MNSDYTDIKVEINSSKTPVMLDFYADWCEPCKRLLPIFEELSVKYLGRVKFLKIDVNKYPEIAQDFAVRNLPCLIIVSGQRELTRTTGFQQKNSLEKRIDEAISGLN